MLVIDSGQDLLVSAKEAARLCGVGRSLWYSMHSSGELGPLPIKLGKRTLWRRQELEEWVRVGCPERTRWSAMQKND